MGCRSHDGRLQNLPSTPLGLAPVGVSAGQTDDVCTLARCALARWLGPTRPTVGSADGRAVGAGGAGFWGDSPCLAFDPTHRPGQARWSRRRYGFASNLSRLARPVSGRGLNAGCCFVDPKGTPGGVRRQVAAVSAYVRPEPLMCGSILRPEIFGLWGPSWLLVLGWLGRGAA